MLSRQEVPDDQRESRVCYLGDQCLVRELHLGQHNRRPARPGAFGGAPRGVLEQQPAAQLGRPLGELREDAVDE